MPLASSDWTFLCLLIVVFHFRHLERRWGSPKFLAHLIVTALFGRIAAQAVVPGSHPAAEATRLANLVAVIVPLVMTVTRYHLDLPSLGSTKLFGDISINEHVLLWLCTGKVVLFPFVVQGVENTGASARLYYTPVTPLGAQWRFVMVAASVGLALLIWRRQKVERNTGTKGLVSGLLDWLTHRFCAPLLHVAQPIISTLCGEPSQVAHRMPPAPQPLRANRAPTRRSRAIGSLVHDDDDLIPEEIMEQLAQQQRLQQQQDSGNSVESREGPQGSGFEQHPHASPDKIDMLESLQLGATRPEVIQALIVCGGDVNLAAAFIMEHHH